MKTTTQDINGVHLIGKLVTNPKIGGLKNIFVCNFRLLVCNHLKDEKDTFQITCLGKWAEFAARVLQAGDRVNISARLTACSYYNQRTKTLEHYAKIVANQVLPLNLDSQVINQRYKRWGYFDVIKTRKAIKSLVDAKENIIPKPLKYVLFFSKDWQVNIYWLICCFKKWRCSKKLKR